MDKNVSVQAELLMIIAEGMRDTDSIFFQGRPEATFNELMAELVKHAENRRIDKEWKEV